MTPRVTIERLRTLVLAAGAVLVALLVGFLARGRLRNPLNLKELPKKLGVNIVADATGFTMDHAFGGHSRYRIHASKAVQFKDNHAILKDVKIELYGDDGARVDRIEGAEFEYDQKSGTALASGPVAITLMRPETKAAANAAQKGLAGRGPGANAPGRTMTPIEAAAARHGEIHVQTSGLTFDTQSGVATTAARVDFSTAQGSGSAVGASYDSKGFLVLNSAVELNTKRGGQTVEIHAQHAEFERERQLCRLHAAVADYRGDEATAGDATVSFRADGSAEELDALNGFNMTTAKGSHVAAPRGRMDFDEQNEPRHGLLEGGVTIDSSREAQDGAGRRRMRASSPRVELDFTAKGELRHAHLERGVEMHSDSVSETAGRASRASRTWNSPVADVDFRDNGKGEAEPAAIRGVQGVVVTGESQRGNGVAEPSRMAADQVTGVFGAGSALTSLVGIGHASVAETTASGTKQTSTGDRLEAHFVQEKKAGAGSRVAGLAGSGSSGTGSSGIGSSGPGSGSGPGMGFSAGAGQIESAAIDGHVVLTQQAAGKGGAALPAAMMAWAGRAVYDASGMLHLTVSPRVEDGGLQLTADAIDVAHASGDALARGDVKASWLGGKPGAAPSGVGGGSGSGPAPGLASDLASGAAFGPALGGQGPAHAVAAEAQMSHGANGSSTVTFRGHARLWQQANSVAGPLIVLDRQRETMTAHSADPGEPVRAVLLSAGGLGSGKAESGADAAGKPRTPTVIRVSGGDLKYSEAEHRAVMRGGALGAVTAATAAATSVSDEVELVLLPPGNHAGRDGGAAQVDRMTARGRVQVSSGDRKGTGEQLVYTGESGEYVLTGTAAAPPRMTDGLRGTVTGEALIFHGRDDSVSIEGGGGRTSTETRTPK